MKVGYARVSTKDQNLKRQIDKLRRDHCQKIYKEKRSGATTRRPQLRKMLNHLQPHDIVEVVALDRLGRNRDDDLRLLHIIKSKHCTIDLANFKGMKPPSKGDYSDQNSYEQALNTYEFVSNIIIQAIAYVAETERREIKERQRQGIKANSYKYKGKQPKFHLDSDNVLDAISEFFNKDKNGLTTPEIARIHGMSQSELYLLKDKYLHQHHGVVPVELLMRMSNITNR